MTDTLSVLDEAFLELEELDPGALMNIGGILVFEPVPGGGAPTIEAVRASVATRLLPRYTERLSSPRTRHASRLHWEHADAFDVADHVRHAALPAPGSDAELCEWTGEFFSHPLDRTKPLWETVLLEGLEHGRWALASKVHHCMVDGVGSAGSMNLTLDHSPEPSQAATQVDFPAHEERARRVGEPVRHAALAGASAGSAVINAALHPREAVEHSRKLAVTLARDQLKGAARTSLNVPIGQGRRYALVRVPTDELKRIGHSLDVSMNDVALAACTTGLRRLLIERGEHLPRHGLRAMVPVNLRGGSDSSAVGNRVSSLFVDLPVAEPVAILRLHEITARTQRLKSSGAATVPSALFDLAALAPPVVMRAALARTAISTRLFSVTITNVPGPRSTLYAFGAPLREVHPIVPLAADHAVGIAIFSYDGLVTFGLNADAGAMHDLDVLARGIEEGIEDLRRALSHHHTETKAR